VLFIKLEMSAFHLYKKLLPCKLCGGEVDSGSICNSCKDKIKRERKKKRISRE
jgi:hypothetical protein